MSASALRWYIIHLAARHKTRECYFLTRKFFLCCCLAARWMKVSRNPHTRTRPNQQSREREEKEEREVHQPLFPLLFPTSLPPPVSSGPSVSKTSLLTPRPKDGADGKTTHRRHHGAPEENKQPAFERCNAKKSSGRGDDAKTA